MNFAISQLRYFYPVCSKGSIPASVFIQPNGNKAISQGVMKTSNDNDLAVKLNRHGMSAIIGISHCNNHHTRPVKSHIQRTWLSRSNACDQDEQDQAGIMSLNDTYRPVSRKYEWGKLLSD